MIKYKRLKSKLNLYLGGGSGGGGGVSGDYPWDFTYWLERRNVYQERDSCLPIIPLVIVHALSRIIIQSREFLKSMSDWHTAGQQSTLIVGYSLRKRRL